MAGLTCTRQPTEGSGHMLSVLSVPPLGLEPRTCGLKEGLTWAFAVFGSLRLEQAADSNRLCGKVIRC
jgi:hypothetical protein